LEIRSPDGVAMLAWPIRSLIRTAADAPGDQVTLRISRAPERLILLNGLLLGLFIYAIKTHGDPTFIRSIF